MEKVLTVFSGLVVAMAYIPFILGTIRGSVVPNRASWIVWFVNDGLMASSALMVGIGPAAIMPVVWGAGASIMLFLSLTKGTRDSFTNFEKTCLVLSGFGILLWVITGSPRLALIASVSSVCIGGIPTVVKSWNKPWTETPTGWVLMIVATIFSCLAIQKWTFDSGFLPITVGIFQVIVTLPLLLHIFGFMSFEQKNKE